MKKGYKVKYDKKAKEYMVAYYNISDKDGFRKAYLTDYIGSEDAIIVSINTNLMKQGVDVQKYCKEIETVFGAAEVEFRILPIPNTREKKLLGIRMGTEKGKAFLVLAKVTGAFLLGEFFERFVTDVDVMLGINYDKEFETLVHDFQNGYEEYLYEIDGFQHVIYDSVLIESVRTNFDYFPDVDF